MHPPRSWLFLLTFVSTLAAMAGVARGDTLIAPAQAATTDVAIGSGIFRQGNLRSQIVYGSSHFPQNIGLVITELRFRPDYFYGFAFTSTIANIQLKLSTTQRNPDGLSTTMNNNVGPDSTTVFNGALPLSSRFTGPANGPKDADMIVPLSTPFLYNPAAGNLLLEIFNHSGQTAVSYVGGTASNGDAASRANGNIGSGTGTTDTGAEAVIIVYTPTNQPPTPPRPTLLVRGPYLQNATLSNIVVRWRTDRATNAIVRFGPQAGTYPWAITNATWGTNHSVVLTNLAAGGKYFYAIAAGETNFVGTTNHFFVLPPATNRPIRIWAMGDFGTTGIYGNGALPVRDAYMQFTADRYTDVWLMLGDNAYPNGTDAEYQRAVFNVYSNILRQTVAWPTLGNHEIYAGGQLPYFSIFDLPAGGEGGGVPSGTERYYSFNYANVHFVCLDSELSSLAEEGPMATWLAEDLQANTNEWVIAYWHTPPYTKGSHDSDNDADSAGRMRDMRQNLVPILEAHNVDLVLGGHSHNYERSLLMHGHYGPSFTLLESMFADSGSGKPEESGPYLKFNDHPHAGRGTVYIVAGSGGFATFQTGRHPIMHEALLETGSLILDVKDGRLDATFLSGTGQVRDRFTMLKALGPEPLRVTRLRRESGEIHLEFKTIAGRQYVIEHATQIGPANWMPLTDAITATGATTRWSDADFSAGNHFFRVVDVTNAP